MRTYNIMELVDATNYGFTVSGTTIFTAQNFYNVVRAAWNHHLFDAYTAVDSMTDAAALVAAKSEFKAVFDSWSNMVGANYKKAFDALLATYDPLENYYREESGSETLEKHKGSKYSTGEETITTPRVKTKTTTYKSAFDSSAETETDALVSEPTEGTDKVERDAAKNYTIMSDIDASTYDHDTRTFADRVTRGNIGVTTSQQMLMSELDLRLKDYSKDAIKAFILEYTYYVKGVE